jgi:hypothetical protein
VTDRERLHRIHELRMKAHWGDRYDVTPWPQTDAEWRQTPHGAPWDSAVNMAQWHLDFARKLQAEGLLDA